MTIREAEESDSEAIAELMGVLGYPSTKEEIRTRLQEGDHFVLVAELQGTVVGFVSFHAIPLFHAFGKLGRITALCVGAEARQQGLGRALLNELEERAKRSGCSRIEVTSGDQREVEAHRFYQACGYRADSRRFQRDL